MEDFKNRLGRSTWNFLHVLANGYPNVPTKRDKLLMRNFLDTLTEIYPCKLCAVHMKSMFAKNPYKMNTRNEFKMYLCKIHNIVNKRLGKDIYECKIDNL